MDDRRAALGEPPDGTKAPGSEAIGPPERLQQARLAIAAPEPCDRFVDLRPRANAAEAELLVDGRRWWSLEEAPRLREVVLAPRRAARREMPAALRLAGGRRRGPAAASPPGDAAAAARSAPGRCGRAGGTGPRAGAS